MSRDLVLPFLVVLWPFAIFFIVGWCFNFGDDDEEDRPGEDYVQPSIMALDSLPEDDE